jgi:Transglutaminase elicitor
MKKFATLALLVSVGGAYAERWDRSNNPEYFNSIAKNKMVLSFVDLPLKGELEDSRLGWSETYWPSNLGGIAYRWNHPSASPFNEKLYTKEELRTMSEEKLSQLSPAELYDIAMGDYSYSLTRKVLKLYSPKDLWWEGICHGWSLAASHYPEPDKTVIINKDGIKVPFGSSDVKGLLSMHDAYNSKGFYARVGDRCSVPGKVKGEESEEDGNIFVPSKKDAEKSECADVNAGAFHVVLASMIGLNSQGFVADVDRFNDVWNQPVTSYESSIVREVPLNSKDLKNGVDRKIQVKTVMTYGEELQFFNEEALKQGELNFVSKVPVTGTPAQAFRSKNYEYVLELNREGNIIGGEWLSETRPDMLWLKAKDLKFNNGKLPLQGLNLIYKPVSPR